MEIGLIGMGKMGLNIAMNMRRNDVSVTGFDIQNDAARYAEEQGIPQAVSVEDLISSLSAPRMIWMMLPAGKITRQMVQNLTELLQAGDIVLDGGNSFYEDSVCNYEMLKRHGIHFFDVGTSGGMDGALHGANFMIGGDEQIFRLIEDLFKKIAQEGGYLYTGKPGSGHYLKMVHNGIEYGMMQAIAEGFDLLQHSPYSYENAAVAELWNHGSVIRSWLMELASNAFQKDPQLSGIKGIMYASGEGQWTVEEALKRKVAIPVITAALMMRYRSLEEDTFTGKVVASLRKGFGGHKTA